MRRGVMNRVRWFVLSAIGAMAAPWCSACTQSPCGSCAAGTVCMNAVCRSVCNLDEQCGAGEWCSPLGVCDNQVQPVTRCGQIIRCPDGTQCISGSCLNKCEQQTDCYPDEYCKTTTADHVCVPKARIGEACQRPLECSQGTCDGNKCVLLCSAPRTCPLGYYCTLAETPSHCAAQVSYGADCSTDLQCLDEVCWEGSCNFDCSGRLCPGGAYCGAGGAYDVCLAQKQFTENCEQDNECLSTVCAPVDAHDSTSDASRFCSTACTTHMDCPVTYYCDAATEETRRNCLIGGIPGQTCHSSRECASPKICTLVNIGDSLSVECRSPTAGTLNVGETCVTSNAGQCKSNLCLIDSAFPTTPYCTQPCQLDSDCANGLTCQRYYFNTSSLVVDICKKPRT
jgi:hypothetical protein